MKVSGLVVRDDVPNTDSISSTFDEGTYRVLKGIRELPFLEGDAAEITPRTKRLAEQIELSGEINPLIVVYKADGGSYILEGYHRFSALQILGKKSFPALVVEELSLTENPTMTATKILQKLDRDLEDLGFQFPAIQEWIDSGDDPLTLMPLIDRDVDYGWEQVGEAGEEPIFAEAHALIDVAWKKLIALKRR